jgi:hypothetical protein
VQVERRIARRYKVGEPFKEPCDVVWFGRANRVAKVDFSDSQLK